MARYRNLTFHKGIDYAVVMFPGQATNNALAHLYGEDRYVTKYGMLFAAAPDLYEVLKLAYAEIHNPGTCRNDGVDIDARIQEVINKLAAN